MKSWYLLYFFPYTALSMIVFYLEDSEITGMMGLWVYLPVFLLAVHYGKMQKIKSILTGNMITLLLNFWVLRYIDSIGLERSTGLTFRGCFTLLPVQMEHTMFIFFMAAFLVQLFLYACSNPIKTE